MTKIMKKPIDCRRCCLMLMVMASYYHVVTSITVYDHVSKEQDAGDGNDTNDDTRLEKVEDEDPENKHFMDVYSLQSGPQQLEFGHVFEDPNVWEQRYEKKDFDAQRYQGKVKWGDKDGGYGEQYWDLNHGGAGESAHDYDENGRYEEPTTMDYGQETRRRSVIYKPMVITFVKSRPKKPVRTTRHNSKRLESSATATAPTAAPEKSAKKNAPVLVFDMKTGVVLDESTGNKFFLKPLDDK